MHRIECSAKKLVSWSNLFEARKELELLFARDRKTVFILGILFNSNSQSVHINNLMILI